MQSKNCSHTVNKVEGQFSSDINIHLAIFWIYLPYITKKVIELFLFHWWIIIYIHSHSDYCLLYFLFGGSQYLAVELHVPFVCGWCVVWKMLLDCIGCQTGPCCKYVIFTRFDECGLWTSEQVLVFEFD